MDFLDPKKFRRNQLLLLVGYGLMAIAIAFATLVLLYQATGYGVDREGKVIQYGLVFVSSQPRGADIYLNGAKAKSTTNSKLKVQSGDYELKLTAEGYRNWVRNITVNGDDVQHFDYPFLFPSVLKTESRANYATLPAFASQSPDHRWLVVQPTSETAVLRLYDLRNPDNLNSTDLSLETVATASDGAQTWTAVEWASDNRHVLLRHDYTVNGAGSHEYIVLDRADPEASVNVSAALSLADNETLTLFNKKPTQFYAFDATTSVLRTLSTDNSLDTESLEHVVAFKSYQDDTLLYATSVALSGSLPQGTVSVVLRQGDKTRLVRNVPVSDTYSLDFADYGGDQYVVLGASSDNAVYLYKDLQGQQLPTAASLPKPWRRFPLAHPTHVSFSSSSQFILAESGQNFWVYDAENVKTYHYTATQPIDQPQTYASWMDGSHLTYVSGGRLLVFDYDYQNPQILQAASPAYLPAFDQDYKYVYNLAPGAAANVPAALFATPLTVIK